MSVTRQDLEAKLAEISTELNTQADKAQRKLLPVGIGALVLMILLAFLIGRRRGRRRSTIVEIRRV